MGFGIVIIGRNEGDRLVACLRAIAAIDHPIVYVDSGSTDDSPAVAKRHGAIVLNLDLSHPFTAARARNAGYRRLRELQPGLEFIQFVDGDCQMASGWLECAEHFLMENRDVAAVCGRRRERYPDRSIYNLLCDMEWNTPIGSAKACGGDALMRVEAFDAVGGYRDDLIAGEEPELCYRMRQQDWKVWRLDADMTLHDADITRFRQWWRRSMRGGYAYANISALHRGSDERFCVRETLRAIVWAGLLPIVIIGGALLHKAVLAGALIYPLQIARIASRRNISQKSSWIFAFFVMLAKFPELQGTARYLLTRLRKKRSAIIEYKAYS